MAKLFCNNCGPQQNWVSPPQTGSKVKEPAAVVLFNIEGMGDNYGYVKSEIIEEISMVDRVSNSYEQSGYSRTDPKNRQLLLLLLLAECFATLRVFIKKFKKFFEIFFEIFF
jgi:hypothetical protein